MLAGIANATATYQMGRAQLQQVAFEAQQQENSGAKSQNLTQNSFSVNQRSLLSPQHISYLNALRTNFNAGQRVNTGNATDLSLSQNHTYFVLSSDGKRNLYSQGGEWLFDGTTLIDPNTHAKVLGFDSDDNLVGIDYAPWRLSDAIATTQVELEGILNASAVVGTLEILETPIYTSSAKVLLLTLEFRKQLGNNWLVEIKDSQGQTLNQFHLNFSGSGTLLPGSTQAQIIVDGQPVTFNFGDSNGITGLLGLSGPNSTVALDLQDGRPQGQVNDISFNAAGQLLLSYNNGEQLSPLRLALANITRPHTTLSYFEPGLYQANKGLTLGHAGLENYGSVFAGTKMLANHEPTRQFSDILRYHQSNQASAQVIAISHKAVKQLYENSESTP